MLQSIQTVLSAFLNKSVTDGMIEADEANCVDIQYVCNTVAAAEDARDVMLNLCDFIPALESMPTNVLQNISETLFQLKSSKKVSNSVTISSKQEDASPDRK